MPAVPFKCYTLGLQRAASSLVRHMKGYAARPHTYQSELYTVCKPFLRKSHTHTHKNKRGAVRRTTPKAGRWCVPNQMCEVNRAEYQGKAAVKRSSVFGSERRCHGRAFLSTVPWHAAAVVVSAPQSETAVEFELPQHISAGKLSIFQTSTLG